MGTKEMKISWLHNMKHFQFASYVIAMREELEKIEAVFEIAKGESHFPKGLAFPRLAKVISRMVWHFRAWRKSFPERLGISAPGESHFPNGLRLSPRGGKYFPKGLKCERIIYL